MEELRAKGITSDAVLAAIGSIPRHFFFDKALIDHAYQDKAFPIGEGQTISQPYTVARQTELILSEPGAKILEIGTGSGFQCAVLCALGYRVYSLEYQLALHHKAKAMLSFLGHRPTFLAHGDGSKGLATHAPFSAILCTAGAPAVPQSLVKQLKTGGRLVIPVGDGHQQRMMRLTKQADGTTTAEDHGAFRFVPLLGKEGWGL